MSTPADGVLAEAAVYYGSCLGRVERAAHSIAGTLGIPRCFDLHFDGIDGITDRPLVVLGLSTWNTGDLQRDWEVQMEHLSRLDWSGCIAAMFCLGDQYGYPRTFGDGLGLLWDAIGARGARLIGRWDPAGYEFEASKGIRDGSFLGLVLDDDNQSSVTERRIALWCEQVRGELAGLI